MERHPPKVELIPDFLIGESLILLAVRRCDERQWLIGARAESQTA